MPLYNIDQGPMGEDWLKYLTRDVDTKGRPIKNRFDMIAERKGRKFTPLWDRKKRRKRECERDEG